MIDKHFRKWVVVHEKLIYKTTRHHIISERIDYFVILHDYPYYFDFFLHSGRCRTFENVQSVFSDTNMRVLSPIVKAK